ncbi:AMP-binding protein [Halodesulfovibrio aestuarii]|uniref:D-alanine--poly(Phosphoribitol) ligase subunit 1 n=1 Tax=Halodesulfovibrio aestuarii TaxID=126333 RepID=A0A8G2F7J9_9BACT|nr:AMP-binding protein [Halodesulfovibrio aestuarii]SHJ01454.1 D-alanine--poly(phosphoribitol) ligase subunit 1 [Halodesulfovibrio aestuarii]
MYYCFEQLRFKECDIEKDKIAVSGSDRDLTWQELKFEVEELIETLRSYNLPTGHPIVIYGHKEVKFIASIVACLSLQLPYIPVDTIYPEERLNKIIETVQSSIVINTITGKISRDSSKTLVSYAENDPIAYIMFTSGSTGEPKGVQITHGAVADFVKWLRSDFNISSESVFMNQAPLSFDLSGYELFGFLSYGGTVVLNSRENIQDLKSYFDRVKSYACNTWVSTPSFISKYLMSSDFNQSGFDKLQKFIFCGEVLPVKTAKKIVSAFPESQLINSYGPTEATVAVTMVNIDNEILDAFSNESLPVGRVRGNKKVRIDSLEHSTTGEIIVFGENVSIGYFNNPSLNEKKFESVNGMRSFNTGDFGYIKDGLLFFANRADDMIKLHGYRIELGEIDSTMMNVHGVECSVTIPLKRGNEIVKLVSFVISTGKSVDGIKKEITNNLPYYMMPSDIVFVDDYPKTINHKIDKKKLVQFYTSS